jgi:hypothetical protein
MERICTKKRGFAFILTSVLLLSGCGGSNTTKSSSKIGTKSDLQTDGSIITNKSDDTQSSYGSNNAQNSDAVASFKTKAPAEDVTSFEDTLFIAEGDKGVEIVRIGYNDRIDHEVIATISGVNATFVALSEDRSRLYVQNREGYVNVFNISDIKNPQREGLYTANAIKLSPTTKDGLYEFVTRDEKGMYIYDISNPSSKKRIGSYTETPVYGIVLIDNDTKALTATKTSGIDLLDISDFSKIKKVGNHPLSGTTLGLSLNETRGVLFVANGDQGVKVFNLNIFLNEMVTD